MKQSEILRIAAENIWEPWKNPKEVGHKYMTAHYAYKRVVENELGINFFDANVRQDLLDHAVQLPSGETNWLERQSEKILFCLFLAELLEDEGK